MEGNVFDCLAEGGERGRSVLAALRLRADGRAEHVIEVLRALRGRDGIAPSDVRLVDETLVAALDERETIPPEVLGLAVAVVRTGELAVDVVIVGVLPVALGDGEHLVEVTIAVGPVPFANEATRRVVGVLGGHAVGRR